MRGGPEASRREPSDLPGRVRQAAEVRFAGTSGSHDWDHTLRVCRLCRRIGAAEGADMDVLLPAAYLHDIARSEQDRRRGEVCHAEAGAAAAAAILARLALPADRTEAILHCIRGHRFRGRERPRSLEARVLFDADKLDAIGAVGVARAYWFAGAIGAMLHNPGHRVENTRAYGPEDTGYREYRLKLRAVRDRMLTETGRRMAEERHRFMTAFFDRFVDEIDGRR